MTDHLTIEGSWQEKELLRLIETGRDYEPSLAKHLLDTMQREEVSDVR